MLKKENVWIKDFSNKEEVFNFIGEMTNAKNSNISISEVVSKLKAREEEVSTGFEDGIAIPHGKIENLDEPIINVIRTSDINWPSMDGNGTNFIICILVPINGGSEHLKILGEITRKLVNSEFRNALKAANEDEIVSLINGVSSEKLDLDDSKVDEFYLGVTKCPVGIAHTYLAAEKLSEAAEELGVKIKVETQGSAGVENKITSSDVNRCNGVIIAADAQIEGKSRFVGKKVLEVPIKPTLTDAKSLFNDVKSARVLEGVKEESSEENVSIMKAVMNGVSHMIPFVVLGGLFIALSLSIGGEPTANGLVIPEGSIWNSVSAIGGIGFMLMIPILAGYIAYAIAGRAALAPAMIGAMIANDPNILQTGAGTGFLGALLVGILVGYIVRWINTWKVPKELRAIMPIFVIPILTTIIIAILFIFVLGKPLDMLMNSLNGLLSYLSSNTYLSIFLGIALGSMIAIDMGGPFNKTAFIFGVGSITAGHPEIMGAVAAAIAVPPLSMGLATLIRPRVFTEEEKGTGIAALLMGFIGITEGAIPFAASDPKRVIPSIMIGSATASVIALQLKITNMVPHGGPIVGILGGTNNLLLYLLSILIGVIVSALIVVSLKSKRK